MTDAALPVTERAVERFAEAYLRSLGADVEKEDRRWKVSLPEDADTDLELDGAVLEVASDPDQVGEGRLAVAPESPFVERLLDQAAERTPLGSISLTAEEVDLQVPPWITEGPAEVTNRSFTPYYDRRAVCALFHVGIETVSEYQSESLHAVAIDCNDHEERPRLAETYLDLTDDDLRELPEGPALDAEGMTDSLDAARSTLEEEISPLVRDTRERATRAAEVELDEYRQFVRQRRDELNDEIDRLNARIAEATEAIDDASSQDDRVEALRQRKELQSELDEVRSELEELTAQIEAGFPEKREKIRDRHALTVRIRPVAATGVSYERGDLDLTLSTHDGSATTSYAYAIGAGVMDDPACERCGQPLTVENPLALDGDRTIGSNCCGE